MYKAFKMYFAIFLLNLEDVKSKCETMAWNISASSLIFEKKKQVFLKLIFLS